MMENKILYFFLVFMIFTFCNTTLDIEACFNGYPRNLCSPLCDSKIANKSILSEFLYYYYFLVIIKNDLNLKIKSVILKSKIIMNKMKHAENGNTIQIIINGKKYNVINGVIVKEDFKTLHKITLHNNQSGGIKEGAFFGSFTLHYTNWWSLLKEFKTWGKQINIVGGNYCTKVFIDKHALTFTSSKNYNFERFDKEQDVDVELKLKLYYKLFSFLGKDICRIIYEMDLGKWNFCTDSVPEILQNFEVNFEYLKVNHNLKSITQISEYEEGVVEVLGDNCKNRYLFDFDLPIISRGHVFKSYIEVVIGLDDFLNQTETLNTCDQEKGSSEKEAVNLIKVSKSSGVKMLTCGFPKNIFETLTNSERFRRNVKHIYSTEGVLLREKRTYVAAFLEILDLDIDADTMIDDFKKQRLNLNGLKNKIKKRDFCTNLAQILECEDNFRGSHNKNMINKIKWFVSKKIYNVLSFENKETLQVFDFEKRSTIKSDKEDQAMFATKNKVLQGFEVNLSKKIKNVFNAENEETLQVFEVDKNSTEIMAKEDQKIFEINDEKIVNLQDFEIKKVTNDGTLVNLQNLDFKKNFERLQENLQDFEIVNDNISIIDNEEKSKINFENLQDLEVVNIQEKEKEKDNFENLQEIEVDIRISKNEEKDSKAEFPSLQHNLENLQNFEVENKDPKEELPNSQNNLGNLQNFEIEENKLQIISNPSSVDFQNLQNILQNLEPVKSLEIVKSDQLEVFKKNRKIDDIYMKNGMEYEITEYGKMLNIKLFDLSRFVKDCNANTNIRGYINYIENIIYRVPNVQIVFEKTKNLTTREKNKMIRTQGSEMVINVVDLIICYLNFRKIEPVDDYKQKVLDALIHFEGVLEEIDVDTSFMEFWINKLTSELAPKKDPNEKMKNLENLQSILHPPKRRAPRTTNKVHSLVEICISNLPITANLKSLEKGTFNGSNMIEKLTFKRTVKIVREHLKKAK